MSSEQTTKPFGLTSTSVLVVANMIGAGVFTTSGFALRDLGNRSTVMLAWLIGSLIAICGAISYGQLSRRINESGGEYLYLARFIHPGVGFVAGWVSLLAGFTGAIAFAASAFEVYWIPNAAEAIGSQRGVLAIPVVLLFAALHSMALRFGLVTQNAIVGLKLVLILAFGVWAFAFAFPVANDPGSWPGFQISLEPQPVSLFVFGSSLVWISLSYSGFNAAIYIAGEVNDAQRNVPRAMLIGTVCVSLLYLALNFIFLYGAAPEDIKGMPNVGAIAANAIGGPSLGFLLKAIMSVALLSSVSSMVLAGPRVYAKMAEDGLFPRWIASSSSRGPVIAIWWQALAASAVIYFASLEDLLKYLAFTLSISSALAVACVLWTKRPTSDEASRPVYSLIAILYVGATLFLAALLAIRDPWQLAAFAITVGSGLLTYLLIHFVKRRS